MSFQKLNLFIGLLALMKPLSACTSTGINNNDGQILTDPIMTFSVSPASSWTYPPQITSATPSVVFYAPGQSLTQADAIQRANNDISASILFAFDEENILSTGVHTTVTYSPDPIAACVPTGSYPSGTYVGLFSAGAVTQWAELNGAAGAAVVIANCPLGVSSVAVASPLALKDYIKIITVSIKGYSTSRGRWRTISNDIMSILNFRYGVIFRSQITLNE
uniref:Lipoprotein n=1 Tax=Rhabditophanes sp. KR3021 TaxID=114890 RepID=A0AC35UAN1_9BILA